MTKLRRLMLSLGAVAAFLMAAGLVDRGGIESDDGVDLGID